MMHQLGSFSADRRRRVIFANAGDRDDRTFRSIRELDRPENSGV
jgi:hypothetical protein